MIWCSFFLGVWVDTSLKKESAKFDLFRESRYSRGVLTTLSNNYHWFELNIFISRWQYTKNKVQINKTKKLVTMLFQRKKKLREENIAEINYRVKLISHLLRLFFPQHNLFSNLSWHFIPKTFPLSLRESFRGFRDILFPWHFLPLK